MIIITNVTIFADDITKWNLLQLIKKTWTNFQAHFVTAQLQYTRSRPTDTTASLGYSSATPQANLSSTLDHIVPFASDQSQTLRDADAYISELEAH